MSRKETGKCESGGKRQGLRVKVVNKERSEKHGREGGENSRNCLPGYLLQSNKTDWWAWNLGKGTGHEGIVRSQEPDEVRCREALNLYPRVREEATQSPTQNTGGTGLVILQFQSLMTISNVNRENKRKPKEISKEGTGELKGRKTNDGVD